MTAIDSLNAAEDCLRMAKTHLRLSVERHDPEQRKIAAYDIQRAIEHAANALRLLGV